MKSYKLKNVLATAGALIGLALVAISPYAEAQTAALVASSGVEGGGYFRFVREAGEQCGPVAGLTVKNNASTGGVMNLDRLESNEAQIAPIQLDSFAYHAKGRDLSNLRLLMPLFPEAVLFITRASSGVKEGGWAVGGFNLGVGKTDVVINAVSELKGRQVYAVGGAVDTANYINQMGGIGYQVVPVTDPKVSSKNLVADVLQGKILAAVVTGAHPIGYLKELPPELAAQLKILPVNVEVPAYTKMNVSYPTFANGPGTISTVSVRSVLVTQNIQSQTLAPKLEAFRSCIKTKASEMASTVGTSLAWRYIANDTSEPTKLIQAWVPPGKK